MNSPIITRCGFRCDLCAAYRENVERDDRRERLSKGLALYFKCTISPDDLFCDGCLDESPGARRIERHCKIRQCTIEKGLENCSQCEKKDCAKLRHRLVDCTDIEKKIGSKIQKRDYVDCIKPYENKKLLAELASLFSLKPRLVNKEITPTMERIFSFVGRGMDTQLSKIDHFMIENACGGMIGFFSDDEGWCITYRRKGKNLAVIFPERKGLTVHIVLGKKELDAVRKIPKDSLDEGLKKIIKTAKPHSDGSWLRIPLTDHKRFMGVMHILEIKTESAYKPFQRR
jgi:hypothetical protein